MKRPITDLIDDEKISMAFADVVGLHRRKHFAEAIIQGSFYSIDWKESFLVCLFLQNNGFDVVDITRD